MKICKTICKKICKMISKSSVNFSRVTCVCVNLFGLIVYIDVNFAHFFLFMRYNLKLRK